MKVDALNGIRKMESECVALVKMKNHIKCAYVAEYILNLKTKTFLNRFNHIVQLEKG